MSDKDDFGVVAIQDAIRCGFAESELMTEFLEISAICAQSCDATFDQYMDAARTTWQQVSRLKMAASQIMSKIGSDVMDRALPTDPTKKNPLS